MTPVRYVKSHLHRTVLLAGRAKEVRSSVDRRAKGGLTQIPCKFGSCRRHNSGLEQVDFGAPVHLALDGLGAVDLALGLTAGPRC